MINEYGFDSDKYINNVPNPSRKDFTIDVTVRAFNDAKTVKFFDQEAFNKARCLYEKEDVRINNQFVKDLFENAGIEDNPEQMILFEEIVLCMR